MSVHFKGNAKSLPRVWRDLQDEASAAYAHSPLFQKGIVAYIASLSRQASVQNLPLERFSAMFDLPQGAKKITGFTLHRQIYFSRASEILALPTTHPVESVQHPERMVGIHLHSFGEPTPDAQKTLEQYAAICDTSKMDRNNPGISFFKSSEDPKDYFRLLADQLTSTLNDLRQNGHPLMEARQHKFLVGKSKAIGKHRDRFYSFDDSPNLWQGCAHGSERRMEYGNGLLCDPSGKCGRKMSRGCYVKSACRMHSHSRHPRAWCDAYGRYASGRSLCHACRYAPWSHAGAYDPTYQVRLIEPTARTRFSEFAPAE